MRERNNREFGQTEYDGTCGIEERNKEEGT
jgi:hypothetical protein